MKKKGLVPSLTEGYTLLELLVVIGLITILIAFSATSYSTAQKKARDSKRRTDLRTLQNALEQYYSVCKYNYPIIDGAISSVVTDATCEVQNKTILSGLVDPMGNSYICIGCDGTQYKICPPVMAGGKYLETDSSCTNETPGTTDSCCLSNQQ